MRQDPVRLGIAVAGTLLGMFLLSLLLLAGSIWWTGLPYRPTPQHEVSTGDLLALVRFALGVAAGVGAVVALVVAYRRQGVVERAHVRDDVRLFSERYTAAAQLLGADRAAVRLAGANAMAALADDWERNRQCCVDTLCGYLRMPVDLPGSAATEATTHEHQVRWAVLQLIADRLAPGLEPSWQGSRIDFAGVVFDGGSFRGCRFGPGTRVDFTGAKFRSGTLDLGGAGFAGGTVDLAGAEFDGGQVDLSKAWPAGRPPPAGLLLPAGRPGPLLPDGQDRYG